MSTLGEAAKGAADLVAELEAMEQLLDAELAERHNITEQAVRLAAENDQLRVDFAKDMAAIASYRNDIAELQRTVAEACSAEVDARVSEAAVKLRLRYMVGLQEAGQMVVLRADYERLIASIPAGPRVVR